MTYKENIEVSKEYIEEVCLWIETWSKHQDSWIIAQFLKEKGMVC